MLANAKLPSGIRAAIACLAVGGALLAPSAASAQGCANVNSDPNAISLSAARASTLCLLNEERAAHGLGPLHENRRLDTASEHHAVDMAAHHYFAHGDFLGRIRGSRYLAGSRAWTVGENIAWGTLSLATPGAIMNAWMNSPEHRANILNPTFHEIGLGVARGAPVAGLQDGATYATDFGGRQ